VRAGEVPQRDMIKAPSDHNEHDFGYEIISDIQYYWSGVHCMSSRRSSSVSRTLYVGRELIEPFDVRLSPAFHSFTQDAVNVDNCALQFRTLSSCPRDMFGEY
jgi:hypothetical protein